MSADDASQRGRILGSPPCTRTADRSLCVTLTPPAGRVCNLECVYCPFPHAERRDAWPRAGTLEAVLRGAVRDHRDAESITLSGPGEPTLHPRFGQALAAVLTARQVRPGLPVRIVTNALRVLDARVRRLIGFADERVVRLDAAAERVEGAEPPLEALREALADLVDFSVESVFVEGEAGNVGEADVAAWVERVATLGPGRVYVTTVAEEPEVDSLRRAPLERLEAIAQRLRARGPDDVIVLP